MRLQIKLAILLLFSSLGTLVYGQKNLQNPTKLQSSIDSIVQKKMKDAGLVGIGATIIINKKLAWSKGYGYADRENKVPFTTATVMNIASVSKTITGA